MSIKYFRTQATRLTSSSCDYILIMWLIVVSTASPSSLLSLWYNTIPQDKSTQLIWVKGFRAPLSQYTGFHFAVITWFKKATGNPLVKKSLVFFLN